MQTGLIIPITILDDPAAAKYIDGSAFHLYGGKIEALTDVHNAHPVRIFILQSKWWFSFEIVPDEYSIPGKPDHYRSYP